MVNIRVVYILHSVVTRLWLIPVIGSRGNERGVMRVSGIERGLVRNCVSSVQAFRTALQIIYKPSHPSCKTF